MFINITSSHRLESANEILGIPLCNNILFINIFLNMQIGCSALIYLNLANAVVHAMNPLKSLRHFKREMCGSGWIAGAASERLALIRSQTDYTVFRSNLKLPFQSWSPFIGKILDYSTWKPMMQRVPHELSRTNDLERPNRMLRSLAWIILYWKPREP